MHVKQFKKAPSLDSNPIVKIHKMNFLRINILLFCLASIMVSAQQKQTFKQYEDIIRTQFSLMISEPNDSLKSNINNHIVSLFKEVLEDLNSFGYPFDSLKNISKLNSADGFVRIINWNMPIQNGEFQYFGFIQLLDKNKKELKLFQLNDQSKTIQNQEHAVSSEKNWYGALYYKILTTKWGKKTYYTLLGWDGNDNFTNKKLVEILYFDDEKPVFGLPIFKAGQNIQNRLIFEYSEQAKMMLKYDEKLDIIVWDHLAPSQPNFIGQYMYYGPDLSQDGIQFIDGYWILKPNLDLRNFEKSTGKSIKKSF